MYKILIIEDDKTIASLLKENLEKWDLLADSIEDFHDIMPQFRKFTPDLVLLDISLPFYNGYYWCNEIRKESNVPIVFLSSHTENMDIAMAMNMGGDDYITKPFSFDILVAKVQALLRRTYSFHGDLQTMEAKGLILNLNADAISFGEESDELTKNEFKIMQLLMMHKNKVVSREDIMKCLWDSDCFVDDNTLTVNINRLRKKQETLGVVDLIQTKKGLVYIVFDK